MAMRETVEWDAVVSFDIPDSDGQLAQLRYNENGLQEFLAGTKLYLATYSSNGDPLDLVLKESEGRRSLQSEGPGDYHLPAWLNPEALEGATYDRVTCSMCAKYFDLACASTKLFCDLVDPVLPFPASVAWFIGCNGIGLICVLGKDSACTDTFCCDRSTCAFRVCYEELFEECCDDGSIVQGRECCPGLEYCTNKGNGDLNPLCHDPSTEKCCPETREVIPTSECCQDEVRVWAVIVCSHTEHMTCGGGRVLHPRFPHSLQI